MLRVQSTTSASWSIRSFYRSHDRALEETKNILLFSALSPMEHVFRKREVIGEDRQVLGRRIIIGGPVFLKEIISSNPPLDE